MDNKLLRIVDANYNRAKEAIRVCEDFCRFFCNDKLLAGRYKRLRHELTRVTLALPLPYRKLVESRDSMKDVGRTHQIQDKTTKINWKDLMIANMKRSQEALRVLEELSKIIAPKLSVEYLKLRFTVYELERKSFQRL